MNGVLVSAPVPHPPKMEMIYGFGTVKITLSLSQLFVSQHIGTFSNYARFYNPFTIIQFSSSFAQPCHIKMPALVWK
jgi:hypothetical protein